MPPTLLFSSFHNYLDQASGAAISAREVLRELARRGWRVRVLCGSFFDDATADENSFYATLKRRNITPVVERKRAVLAGRSVDFRLVRFLDDGAFRAVSYRDSGVDSVVVAPRSGSGVVGVGAVPSRPAGAAFLQLFAETLRRLSPDVVLTYGGYWLGGDMLKLAKKSGAKTVAWLHNLAYRDAGRYCYIVS